MDLSVIIFIMLIHWLADACLQTNEQATEKWRSSTQLGWHVLTYSIVWFVVGFVLSNSIDTALKFFIITYVCHFATDYCTSIITHNYFEKKDYHNGFVMVIADQILHLIQLFLMFKYIL